jgi:hypothetical protein
MKHELIKSIQLLIDFGRANKEILPDFRENEISETWIYITLNKLQ